MLRVWLRLWVVLTVLWTAYSIYDNRDKLSNLANRDWKLAYEYGLNNALCELKIPTLCKKMNISPWRQSSLNETFMLIVIFVGAPIAMLISFLLLAWVTSGVSVIFGLPIIIILLVVVAWISLIGFPRK
jgi:Ca2+/Na+ antiporter